MIPNNSIEHIKTYLGKNGAISVTHIEPELTPDAQNNTKDAVIQLLYEIFSKYRDRA